MGTNTITWEYQEEGANWSYGEFNALYAGDVVALDSLVDLGDNPGDNAVTIKFYDFTVPKLDLTGFGVDDKIVVDMQDADRFMGLDHNNPYSDFFLTTWSGNTYGFYASNWALWYYSDASKAGSRTIAIRFEGNLSAYAWMYNEFTNLKDNTRSGTFIVASNLNIDCVPSQVQVLLPTPFDNW